MAAANYTTDLTTIATGDLVVDTGTWDESTDAGWDTGGSMVDDQNLYYNNTECVSAQLTKDSNGTGATGPATIMYVHGSTFTIPTDGAVLIHHLWAAPPALNTIANGGVKVLLGNGLADFSAWNCSGNDFIPAPKGGWANYALNPAVGTADDIVGAGASSPYTTVGGAVGATAQARGNPHACNAVRYGRCTSIYTLGDDANGYATFTGFGLVDASSTNKWSLLDPVEGGYKFQGLMSLGLTGTAVDFREANINISIANTINVTSGFNKIEVHNAASNVEWTAVNITSLGTGSRGSFEMIDDCAVTKDTCVFTDMSTFVYQSSASMQDCTYRRTDAITSGTASFDSCTIENNIAASSALASDLADFNACTFISDGSNHAIEINTIGDGSMDWNNYLESYVAGTSASPVTPTSTGNEAVYVNATTGTLTINVGSGYSIPSIRSAGATVNVVSGQVTTTIKVTTRLGVAIEGARVYMEADAGGPITEGTVIFNTLTDVNGEVSDTRSLGSAQPVVGRVRKSTTTPLYSTSPFSGEISNTSGLNLTILMISDE